MAWMSDLYRRYLSRVTSSTTYVPQIDGLRFVAILPVLIYHATLRSQRIYNATAGQTGTPAHLDLWFPSGEIGVALFFFLSGYIIAFPFLKNEKSTRVDLKKFYLRRFVRLWPEYACILVLSFLAATLSGYRPADAPHFNATKQPLIYSLLAGLIYCHGALFGTHNRLNPPMWSLEIEVQFYMLAPIILWMVRGLRKKLNLGLSIGLCIGVELVTELSGGLFPDRVQRLTILKYLYLFLLGIFFSDFALKNLPLQRPANTRYDFGLGLGLIILLATGSLYSWMLFHSYFPLDLRVARNLGLISAIVLIYFGAMQGRIGRRIFAAPWISVTGGMCYSIYLIHDLLIQALAEPLKRFLPLLSIGTLTLTCNLVIVPLVLIVGACVFALIERPLMNPGLLDSAYGSLLKFTRGPMPKTLGKDRAAS